MLKLKDGRNITGENYYNINIEDLYERLNNILPHIKYINSLDKKGILEYLSKQYELKISSESLSLSNKVEEDLLYGSDTADNTTLHFYSDEKQEILYKLRTDEDDTTLHIADVNLDKLNQIAAEIVDKFQIKKETKNKVGLLYNSNNRLIIKNFSLPKFDIDIELNYGAEFKKKSDVIINKLSEDKSNITIFNGIPGVGKSFFIKYLCSKIDRQFVFVPSNMIDSLTNPDVIPILIDKKSCILILEDAEKAVIAREHDNSNPSLVSTILNISDGILGNIMNCSIIVTFNTDRNKIDKALTRKGRLLAEYHFDKLSINESQKLLNYLKKDYKIKEPMTLAELYNLEVDTFHKEEEVRKIGFM